jgi:hypothetical protein
LHCSLYRLNADVNADGQVDAADYVVWRDHYQASMAAAGAQVPEPRGIVLAAFAFFGACCAVSSILPLRGLASCNHRLPCSWLPRLTPWL